MSVWAVGVDLSWSPKNPSGVAAARVEPSCVTVEWTCTIEPLAEIVARISELGRPVTVAVDAPTLVPNARGCRPVERLLQSRFGTCRAGPYPANRTLLGSYNGGRPRGEELVALLGQRLGAEERGIPPRRHGGVWVMEVFPAAALVQLFDLDRALPYKKKRGRSWPACRRAFGHLLALFDKLSGPRLVFRKPLALAHERGKAFKEMEDQADAAFCAYLAALAWLEGERRLELVGSLDGGYIVLPRSPAAGRCE